MTIKRFVFEANGEEVIKVTDGRVTGYIAASIPLEALRIWHKRLGAKLKRAGRLRYRVRSVKRPRLKQRRVHKRRQRPEKRYRGHLRKGRRAAPVTPRGQISVRSSGQDLRIPREWHRSR